MRQSERSKCNSQKKLKNWPGLKEISKAKANSNKAIQAQPAERSLNQQLKGTTRISEIYWKKLTLKQGLATKQFLSTDHLNSDQLNKLKVLYQQKVHLLEEEISKQLQRRNKLLPYLANFVEEHPKEARKWKASLDYLWLAYISKGTQPAMNAEPINTTQAVNDSTINNNCPKDNPVDKRVQNGATVSRLLFQTLWMCSKSTSRLVFCNKARHFLWQKIKSFKFSKRSGGSLLMIEMMIGLIWLCLKNGYLGWHSCTKGFQLSRESEEKRTREAQIETNGSQKHLSSVHFRT